MAQPLETDALIIGAGPVGLFAVFQLGLQGVHAHVVDALPHAGGQCVELYGNKPIYDIPGLPLCTGQELIDRLLQQIQPFAPTFHFSQLVSRLEQQTDARWLVETRSASPQSFLCKTLFIAAGVGAFVPRSLSLEGASALEGRQLHYHADMNASWKNRFANQHVLILGDGDNALETALDLGLHHPQNHQDNQGHPNHRPASVTVVHRREVFSAAPDTVAHFKREVAAEHLQFMAGQITALHLQAHTEPRLQAVQLLLPDGSEREVAVDQLLVLQGLSPKLGPIADWGLAMERRQLQVNPATCATSAPGIFAIGDINHYLGKKKLILCGFHECVLATFAALPLIHPGPAPLLQYTTTSSTLHERLGLA